MADAKYEAFKKKYGIVGKGKEEDRQLIDNVIEKLGIIHEYDRFDIPSVDKKRLNKPCGYDIYTAWYNNNTIWEHGDYLAIPKDVDKEELAYWAYLVSDTNDGISTILDDSLFGEDNGCGLCKEYMPYNEDYFYEHLDSSFKVSHKEYYPEATKKKDRAAQVGSEFEGIENVGPDASDGISIKD